MSKLPETWTYATSLKTNLKSPDGSQYLLRLAPKICIVAPNESNKSAIAEALQLAMSAQAAGVSFKAKPVKQDPQLAAMIPWGQDRGYSEVQWSDGTRSSWSLKAGTRPVHTGHKMGVLPLADVRAALQGNDTTRARFLYNWLCTPVEARYLSANLRSVMLTTLAEVSQKAAAGDAAPVHLGDLVGLIGSEKRKAAKSAQALESLLGGLGTIREVSDAELDGRREQYLRATTKKVLQDIYAIGKAQPSVPVKDLLDAMARELGGKAAVGKIPALEDLDVTYGDAILHHRLSRTARHAVNSRAHHAARGDQLALLEKEVLSLLYRELKKQERTLIAAVTRYLPPSQTLCLRWGDDLLPDRIRMGLQKGSQEHWTLSGSTEARFLAALACAVATPENPLIVVEDRMWDPKTLAQMLAALEKGPAQVVVMSSIMPRGRKRKAWQYVELSRTEGQPLEIASSLKES